jgi:hypothetical protein
MSTTCQAGVPASSHCYLLSEPRAVTGHLSAPQRSLSGSAPVREVMRHHRNPAMTFHRPEANLVHDRMGAPVTGETVAGKAVLVTGANRGLGQALVAEALARGAKRVYAGAREPLAHSDDRVTTLRLDVTSPAQIRAAAERVQSLDLLINNAGIMQRDDLTDPAVLERHLAVNLFGMYAVTQAFRPAVTRSRGAIVNILSANALAPLPLMIPAYSVSKAAAFSLTQSFRALPDPVSAPMAARWRDSIGKLLERQLAQVAPADS